MLATCVPRMRYSSLEIRIAGASSPLQKLNPAYSLIYRLENLFY